MGAPGPNCKSRKCKLCEKEFVPKSSHQSCCNSEIQVPCKFCGKLFTKICTTSDNKVCCSEECATEYMKIRRAESNSKKIRVCQFCGKEFHSPNVRSKYCPGPHYKTCVTCGKEFEIDLKRQPEDVHTCSKECFVKYQLSHRDTAEEHRKMQAALEAKYGEGVTNPMYIPGVQEKQKATNRAKYGTDWYTQTDEYKERSKATCLEKYGTEYYLASQDAAKKKQAKYLEKHCSENVVLDYHK